MNAVLLALALAAPAGAADFCLENARVFDGSRDAAPSELCVRGNRIVARNAGAPRVDVQGAWVLPGFNDAHVHFMDGGLSAYRVDLTTAASAADAARMVGAFAVSHASDAWVLGEGWSQTNFPGGAYPTREDLDAAVADRPVVLEHVDGHLLWANSEAMKRAGVTAETKDPANGSLLRDASGYPTGIFLESAMSLIQERVPPPSPERRREALARALAVARSSGVTSIQGLLAHDASEELDAWRELVKSGSDTIRYFMWGRLEDPKEFLALRKAYADLPPDRFVFGGLKGFVDGVLSARTAVLAQPYSDAPSVNGTPNYTQEELNRLVLKANQLGFQVELHAIGDAAVRMALDAFEASRRKLGKAAPRNKVEHIEVVDPRDLARFKALDVVASMQPSHMTYDNESQNYNDARLGKRVRYAFAWRSMEEAGAPLAFGTDWPVMALDPKIGLYAAVTRAHFDGRPEGGWVAAQRIRLEDAIRHYTEGSAYAEGREGELGALRPGMLADLVVMDAALFEAQGKAILAVPVRAVVFDGRVVSGDLGPF